MYFYGFSPADVQGQLPIVHPVIDHDFVAKDPVLAGELQVRTNLTSLSRQTANFDPISTLALASNACGLTTADTALLNRSNCLLRGVPGEYDRLSSEMSWRRTIVDPLGELWIPFVMVRGDVANINVADQPGVSNHIHVGQEDIGRVMPTAGSNTATRSSMCSSGARRPFSPSVSSSSGRISPASESRSTATRA
jgi:LPS-assembly protein